MFKYRFKITKKGDLKYISHLEFIKAIERIIRRAKISPLYSEGYNPHISLSFGPALALGCESLGEYFDCRFNKEKKTNNLKEKLNEVAPIGLHIIGVKKLDNNHKSLTKEFTIAFYEALIKRDKFIYKKFNDFFIANELIFERKSPKRKKSIDIKPLLYNKPSLKEINEKYIKVFFAIHLDLSMGALKPAELIESIFGRKIAEYSSYRRIKLACEEHIK